MLHLFFEGFPYPGQVMAATVSDMGVRDKDINIKNCDNRSQIASVCTMKKQIFISTMQN